MRCQGCLPADYGRCEGHGKIHSFQCCRRSGPPGRSGEQLLDAKLRGEADALGRSATADLLGSVHGRGLADELRSKERVLNGLVCTGFDDGGADRVGPGPMSIRLAPSCHAGPQFANNHYESPPHRADSLCQARLGSVGRGQHSLPEGFGLSGGQTEEHQVRRQTVQGRPCRRRRSRRSSQTLEAKERPWQGEGRDERFCSPVMKPELKSGVTDFSLSPFCEAAELVDSPRGNVCSPRSLSPAAAQSHFCQASNVQSKLNEEMPQFSPSDSPVSFLSFLERFVFSAEAVHVGLGRFFKLSLQQPHSRTVHVAPACSDLWPCPLPTWEWTGSTRLSPRRRKLRKRLKLRHSLLQLVVATLNWETLGHPTSPPPQACIGFDLTEEQWAMINRLERLVDHFVQAGPISSQSLGRSCENSATCCVLVRNCLVTRKWTSMN